MFLAVGGGGVSDIKAHVPRRCKRLAGASRHSLAIQLHTQLRDIIPYFEDWRIGDSPHLTNPTSQDQRGNWIVPCAWCLVPRDLTTCNLRLLTGKSPFSESPLLERLVSSELQFSSSKAEGSPPFAKPDSRSTRHESLAPSPGGTQSTASGRNTAATTATTAHFGNRKFFIVSGGQSAPICFHHGTHGSPHSRDTEAVRKETVGILQPQIHPSPLRPI